MLRPQPSKSGANGPFAMISVPVAFVQGGTMTPAVSECGMEFGGWGCSPKVEITQKI